VPSLDLLPYFSPEGLAELLNGIEEAPVFGYACCLIRSSTAEKPSIVWIARSMIVNSLLIFMIRNVYKLVVCVKSASSRSVSFYEKGMKNAKIQLFCEGRD
jgi:hypothetical protein